MDNDRLANISPQDREYFEALEARISQAHWDFVEYRTMFYEDSDMTLLNETAPHFFGIVQRALIVSIFTCIRALTDPPESGRKENISLLGLASRLTASGHPLADMFSAMAKDYVAKARPVYQAVSKKIAHFDADHVIGENRKTSFAIRGDDIEVLIDDAARLLDFSSGTFTIRPKQEQPGGAAEVLRLLRAQGRSLGTS